MTIYSVSFQGYSIETTVTANGAEVDTWIRSIRSTYYGQQIIVGLDCEWKPNFQRGGTMNRAAILQLCVDTNCLIIQLFHLDYFPQSLTEFLSNPNCTFAGVEVRRDIAKLSNEYGLCFSNAVDVRELSMRIWPCMFDHHPGLKDLAYSVVGLSMLKPQCVQLSDWEARWLKGEQIQYACIDAFASYKIGKRVIS